MPWQGLLKRDAWQTPGGLTVLRKSWPFFSYKATMRAPRSTAVQVHSNRRLIYPQLTRTAKSPTGSLVPAFEEEPFPDLLNNAGHDGVHLAHIHQGEELGFGEQS